MTWLFCFQVTRPSDGKRVENCKPVGLVAAFPGEKAAWVEVGKLGLEKHLDNSVGPEPTFKEIAEHWRLHELRREGVIGKKAVETVSKWKFQPATKNGQPVAVKIAVEVAFHLY